MNPASASVEDVRGPYDAGARWVGFAFTPKDVGKRVQTNLPHIFLNDWLRSPVEPEWTVLGVARSDQLLWLRVQRGARAGR